MLMAEIRDADDIDFARFYGGYQVTSRAICKGLWRRRLLAGFGGMIETGDGEWFAFLEVPSEERRPSLFRHVLKTFAEAKDKGAVVIKAACDTKIPRAEALMTKLGFKPTNEELDGKAIWEWRF
jgi:hypothetical protein